MRLWLHSPDPEFAPKVQRICELYRAPPPGLTVLSIDEKTCIQALARRYPTVYPAPGRLGRFEFEYKRHGTLVLLAAFDIRTGQLFGQCRPRRTAEDLLHFMEAVATPSIHLGLEWLAQATNPRSGTRFTANPLSSCSSSALGCSESFFHKKASEGCSEAVFPSEKRV